MVSVTSTCGREGAADYRDTLLLWACHVLKGHILHLLNIMTKQGQCSGKKDLPLY
jgi:hypothetical protein